MASNFIEMQYEHISTIIGRCFILFSNLIDKTHELFFRVIGNTVFDKRIAHFTPLILVQRNVIFWSINTQIIDIIDLSTF